MSRIKNILFYYNLVFIFGVMIAGMVTKSILKAPQFLIVAMPLAIYFWGYLVINSSAKIRAATGQLFWVAVSILLLFNFLATSLLAGLNIVFSKSWVQTGISILYLPYPIYFFLVIWHWYKKLKPVAKPEPVVVMETKMGMDHNRRQFLKLVGGTSLSLVVLSLLNPKKAGAAFFGSVPGPGTVAIKDSEGNKIDPAEKQPTDGYKISQADNDNYPYYYGYVDSEGAWYITREDSSGNYRYAKGSSGFATNWTNRSGLTYDYYDAVF